MKLNRVLYIFTSIIMLAIMLAGAAAAQGTPLSPHETTELALNGKKITVTYGRPSMRGRKIVGGLVPYDQVWRTGADEATELKTDVDLVIGSLEVPKGKYTIFTLPSESGWKLIINKVPEQFGAFSYSEKQDLGRVDMKVDKTPKPVEQFTISLTKAGAGAVMKLEWENTSASVGIKLK